MERLYFQQQDSISCGAVDVRNCFVVLKIGTDASPEDVRKAYRRLARERHPDVEKGSDEKFRELQKAYDVLRNPETRRAHERELGLFHDEPTGCYSEVPLDIGSDFEGHSPAFDAFEELTYDLHRGRRRKSGRRENLHVEIVLNRQEARDGGIIPLDVPVHSTCSSCAGRGETLGFFCLACDGRGAVEERKTFPVTIPPHVRSGSSFAYDLGALGLPDVLLHVDIHIH